MTLTKLERKALNAADCRDGKRRSDSDFLGVGEQTRRGLIERGLLEEIAHAGYPMLRTTAEGKAALREPESPKPTRTGPKLKMLKPRLRELEPRLKPLKPR